MTMALPITNQSEIGSLGWMITRASTLVNPADSSQNLFKDYREKLTISGTSIREFWNQHPIVLDNIISETIVSTNIDLFDMVKVAPSTSVNFKVTKLIRDSTLLSKSAHKINGRTAAFSVETVSGRMDRFKIGVGSDMYVLDTADGIAEFNMKKQQAQFAMAAAARVLVEEALWTSRDAYSTSSLRNASNPVPLNVEDYLKNYAHIDFCPINTGGNLDVVISRYAEMLNNNGGFRMARMIWPQAVFDAATRLNAARFVSEIGEDALDGKSATYDRHSGIQIIRSPDIYDGNVNVTASMYQGKVCTGSYASFRTNQFSNMKPGEYSREYRNISFANNYDNGFREYTLPSAMSNAFDYVKAPEKYESMSYAQWKNSPDTQNIGELNEPLLYNCFLNKEAAFKIINTSPSVQGIMNRVSPWVRVHPNSEKASGNGEKEHFEALRYYGQIFADSRPNGCDVKWSQTLVDTMAYAVTQKMSKSQIDVIETVVARFRHYNSTDREFAKESYRFADSNFTTSDGDVFGKMVFAHIGNILKVAKGAPPNNDEETANYDLAKDFIAAFRVFTNSAYRCNPNSDAFKASVADRATFDGSKKYSTEEYLMVLLWVNIVADYAVGKTNRNRTSRRETRNTNTDTNTNVRTEYIMPPMSRFIYEDATMPIEEKLRLSGLKRITIAGDGACMFDSVAYALKRFDSSITAQTLREDAVKYVVANWDAFKTKAFKNGTDNLYANADEYADDMSKKGTWGGDLELSALANISKLRIAIISPKQTIFISSEADKPVRHITIVYNGTNHYDSTEPILIIKLPWTIFSSRKDAYGKFATEYDLSLDRIENSVRTEANGRVVPLLTLRELRSVETYGMVPANADDKARIVGVLNIASFYDDYDGSSNTNNNNSNNNNSNNNNSNNSNNNNSNNNNNNSNNNNSNNNNSNNNNNNDDDDDESETEDYSNPTISFAGCGLNIDFIKKGQMIGGASQNMRPHFADMAKIVGEDDFLGRYVRFRYGDEDDVYDFNKYTKSKKDRSAKGDRTGESDFLFRNRHYPILGNNTDEKTISDFDKRWVHTSKCKTEIDRIIARLYWLKPISIHTFLSDYDNDIEIPFGADLHRPSEGYRVWNGVATSDAKDVVNFFYRTYADSTTIDTRTKDRLVQREQEMGVLVGDSRQKVIMENIYSSEYLGGKGHGFFRDHPALKGAYTTAAGNGISDPSNGNKIDDFRMRVDPLFQDFAKNLGNHCIFVFPIGYNECRTPEKAVHSVCNYFNPTDFIGKVEFQKTVQDRINTEGCLLTNYVVPFGVKLVNNFEGVSPKLITGEAKKDMMYNNKYTMLTTVVKSEGFGRKIKTPCYHLFRNGQGNGVCDAETGKDNRQMTLVIPGV